jgi:hypothetical protein
MLLNESQCEAAAPGLQSEAAVRLLGLQAGLFFVGGHWGKWAGTPVLLWSMKPDSFRGWASSQLYGSMQWRVGRATCDLGSRR